MLDSNDLRKLKGGESIVTSGLVTIRQRPVSANGVIFLLMEDEHGFINVVVPKTTPEQYSEAVHFATFLRVEGKFERDGGVMNVVGRRFVEMPVGKLVHASRDFH
jgi:error-prone DNA polymerase